MHSEPYEVAHCSLMSNDGFSFWMCLLGCTYHVIPMSSPVLIFKMNQNNTRLTEVVPQCVSFL